MPSLKPKHSPKLIKWLCKKLQIHEKTFGTILVIYFLYIIQVDFNSQYVSVLNDGCLETLTSQIVLFPNIQAKLKSSFSGIHKLTFLKFGSYTDSLVCCL